MRLYNPTRQIRNPFSRKPVASDSSELMKYAKDPSQFAEYAKMRNQDDEQYQEHLRKMKNVAESRKNMRVDFRPTVVAKTMYKELLLFVLAICAAGGLPLYFLKVRPAQLKFREQVEAKAAADLEMQRQLELRKKTQYAKENYRTDMSLTTEEKGLRMTGEELKAKIEREERSYERAVLR